MHIHILTDNRTARRGFLAEHGLSLLIQHQGRTILMDTGQSDVYVRNAFQMGLSLSEADAIVLSHGHYDHTGGLPAYPKAAKPIPVYLQAGGLFAKHALIPDGNTMREIGIPWKPDTLPKDRLTLHPLQERLECLPGVQLLPRVPCHPGGEPLPEGFFVSTDSGREPDYLQDEQLLVLETTHGLAVFAGCAHAGILNCLTHVRNAFPGKPLALVMGGLHLSGADAQRMDRTILALQAFGIQKLVPLHCTGPSAIASSSMTSVLATGKTLEEAAQINDMLIEASLGGLPEPKRHCSLLGATALQRAIADYRNNEAGRGAQEPT